MENIVSTSYGFSQPPVFQQNKKGFKNQSFFVSSGSKRYVFVPIANPYFLKALKILRQRGFKTPELIQTTDKKEYVEVGGKKWCLLSYLPGKPVQRNKISRAQVFQIARTVALFHKTFEEKVRPSQAFFAPRFPENCPEEIQKEVGALVANFKRQATGMKSTLIHGDLVLENILFSKGNLSGLIDFEHLRYGPAIYDLAAVLTEIPPSLHADFIEQYTRLNPLSSTDIGLIKPMTRYYTLLYALFGMEALPKVTRGQKKRLLEKLKSKGLEKRGLLRNAQKRRRSR
ncbi:MAG: phosphotransferase [Candidatus Diapherotrites archaeon]|uniref:Phosphotransferase n=1 Tax=Candidatus Iainarchaeum sp. TaxID=3101447 RepID=A0A8T4L8F4_9ARCH|nr:phosphotransferase [Candidatus Diapherotrites archaeon]